MNNSADEFDERWYVQFYEDVAEEIAKGNWASGFMHYYTVGKMRGRLGTPPVDEDWYAKTYPLAKEEMQHGKCKGYADHYLRFGRHRGYLPDANCRRSDNPASLRSRFGGLWTDQANALDLVGGRLDLGKISEDEAEILYKWIRDGYVIIENAIPEDILRRALREHDDAFEGLVPKLKYAVNGVGERIDWVPEAKTNPTKALDLHWFSPATRELIFAPKVLHFLHLIFERRALASQTLGFLRGSAQDAHQDSAYVNYTLPMQFAASWVALEDVSEDAGELFYYVGSHRMPEFIYGREYKGVEEAKRMKADSNLKHEIPSHIKSIVQQTSHMQLKKERLLAKGGDVLFWSADLAHGGSPISKERTRKSVVTHYCPAEIVPTYFEYRPKVTVKCHRGEAYYTTSHYTDTEPS